MSFNKVYHMALMQLLLLSGTTALAKERFKLLPTPKKVEWRSNKGIDWYELRSICLVNGSLRPWLAYPLNNMPQTNKGGKGVLTLKIVKDKSVPDNAEAYVLEVKIGEVVIRAREQKGLFYGCQTLLQLLEDGRDQQVHIPVVTITDYPDIPYRSIHLDIKYHLDNMNYYYQMIDRLAQVKVNGIMVEFEDKLKYRNAALVGSDNAISVDEFAALTRYAAERYIEISPLVQGLGHASFILKHDKYHTLRDDPKVDWVMDPLQPGTYELLYRMYDDAIDATPGAKYLHIGGDEVYNLGQSELSRKSGMKPFELQMYWLNKVCEYARLHNRIPVFWDDMIFNMAEVYMSIHDNKSPADSINLLWQKRSPQLDEYLHLFPNDCIYMRWHYSYPKVQGNLNAVKWFKE
ncbi:MAG: glycoside hydrolase family 20 zincin-like fold domain-containing protein, partial [Agriterribacter sp.]